MRCAGAGGLAACYQLGLCSTVSAEKLRKGLAACVTAKRLRHEVMMSLLCVRQVHRHPVASRARKRRVNFAAHGAPLSVQFLVPGRCPRLPEVVIAVRISCHRFPTPIPQACVLGSCPRWPACSGSCTPLYCCSSMSLTLHTYPVSHPCNDSL